MKTITGEWGEAPNGGLLLQLDRYSLVSSHWSGAPRCYWFKLGPFGNLADDTKIWGNDELIFEGSRYTMTIFDTLSNIIFGPLSFSICGPSPLSLNKLIPSSVALEGFNTFGISSANMFGQPHDGQLVLLYTAYSNWQFPPNFQNPQSYATCGTNPVAVAVYIVQLNGTAVGTVSFTTAGMAIFSTSGFALTPGDRLTMIAPNPMDAALSDVAITLVGTRIS